MIEIENFGSNNWIISIMETVLAVGTKNKIISRCEFNAGKRTVRLKAIKSGYLRL